MSNLQAKRFFPRFGEKFTQAFTLGSTVAAVSGALQLLSFLAPYGDFDGYDFVIRRASAYTFFTFLLLAPQYWFLYVIPFNAIWAVLGLAGNYRKVIDDIKSVKQYTICITLFSFVLLSVGIWRVFSVNAEGVCWGIIPSFISGTGILVGHVLDIQLINWPPLGSVGNGEQ